MNFDNGRNKRVVFIELKEYRTKDLIDELEKRRPCVKTGYDKRVCPKNTNSRCEIITKEPKVMRIKAWVSLHNGKPALIDMVKNGENSIPCTISYTVKRGK